jgi:hypothetical protein
MGHVIKYNSDPSSGQGEIPDRRYLKIPSSSARERKNSLLNFSADLV